MRSGPLREHDGRLAFRKLVHQPLQLTLATAEFLVGLAQQRGNVDKHVVLGAAAARVDPKDDAIHTTGHPLGLEVLRHVLAQVMRGEWPTAMRTLPEHGESLR